EQLLDQAVTFAGGKTQRVIVLSIPDWGVTPFAGDVQKDPRHIAAEIDQFNQVNQQISLKRKVHYLDITTVYRELGGLPGYYVEDRLHPSGKIYKRWAEEIRAVILSELETPESAVPAPYFIQENQNSTDVFYAQKVASLNPRGMITCTSDTPVYQVAEKMAQEKTSCFFITDNSGAVSGYVTDITLRDKVIAKRIDGERPVSDIMEKVLVSIDREAFIYEALLLMFQTHTRYILLTKEGKYVGFISR